MTFRIQLAPLLLLGLLAGGAAPDDQDLAFPVSPPARPVPALP